MHVCAIMLGDATMELIAVGVMHTVCFVFLLKIMELLPGGIVAGGGGHGARLPVEGHFNAEILGILGALEAEKWKE